MVRRYRYTLLMGTRARVPSGGGQYEAGLAFSTSLSEVTRGCAERAAGVSVSARTVAETDN